MRVPVRPVHLCRLLAGVVAELRHIHKFSLEDEITSSTLRIPNTPTELFAGIKLNLAAEDAEATKQMGWHPFTLSLDFETVCKVQGVLLCTATLNGQMSPVEDSSEAEVALTPLCGLSLTRLTVLLESV